MLDEFSFCRRNPDDEPAWDDATTKMKLTPDKIHAGDRVHVSVRNREPEWCVVTLPADGGVWVLVPGTDRDVARVDAAEFVVERDEDRSATA